MNFPSTDPSLVTRCGYHSRRDRISLMRYARARATATTPVPRTGRLQIAAYVNCTKKIGLKFVRGSDLKLSVFADADYTAASNGRRSVSGQ